MGYFNCPNRHQNMSMLADGGERGLRYVVVSYVIMSRENHHHLGV